MQNINIFKLNLSILEMKKSNILKLMGVFLVGGGMIIGQDTPRREISNQRLEEKVEEGFYEAVNEISIEQLAQEHIENVEQMQPGSVFFKRLHYGFRVKLGSSELADKELIKWISVSKRLCLKLAIKYGDDKIPKEEYEKLSEKILEVNYWLNKFAQSNSTSKFASKSDINYQDTNLHTAIKLWVRLKTWEFQKLILVSKEVERGGRIRKDYVRELYQKAFRKKEYEEYVKKLNKYELDVENALKGAVNGPMKSVTKEEIGRLGESTRQTTQKTISKYFE